ncbi:S1C family serine protease [Butyrivibrio sp. MC2013]|uniref:S1C family serine protease n=1 Tax=Butyrivibrio sp. MC2013 TaxID=1280686 RepID=UPI0004065445|nr:trypsin-like peptidase domain-containing protein [Butyrivibrio sp. MC2013]
MEENNNINVNPMDRENNETENTPVSNDTYTYGYGRFSGTYNDPQSEANSSGIYNTSETEINGSAINNSSGAASNNSETYSSQSSKTTAPAGSEQPYNSYGRANDPYIQNTYGTYSYSSSAANIPDVREEEKPAKRHPVLKALALILVLSLVATAVASGLWAINHQETTRTTEAEEDLADRIKEAETVDGNGETVSSEDGDQDNAPQGDSGSEEEAAGGADKSQENGADTGNTAAPKETQTSGAQAVVMDVTEVVVNVMPAIVSIDNNYTESINYFGYSMGEQEVTASGSGIIIGNNDTELLIVTNNHVIYGADELKVNFIDGTSVEADIKGTDPDMDLAIIAVQLKKMKTSSIDKIAIATLGNSDTLKLGEPAIAIGNALGYGQSVTTGCISAINRVIETEDGSEGTFIQTDAAINPGNSGGALLNAKGEVIGINSNKFASSEVEGMGFAIPISVAIPIIDDLKLEETRIKASSDKRGYMGITVYTPTGIEGAYVAMVGDGSAAMEGGMEAGDIITAIDGKEITSREDLIDLLDYYEAGTTIEVTVLRKEKTGYNSKKLKVTLQDEKAANKALESEDSQQGQIEEEPGDDGRDDRRGDYYDPFGFDFDFGFGF